jgi:hypothetical protein
MSEKQKVVIKLFSFYSQESGNPFTKSKFGLDYALERMTDPRKRCVVFLIRMSKVSRSRLFACQG